MALLNGKRYTWDSKKGKYVEVKGANSAQTSSAAQKTTSSPVTKKETAPVSKERQAVYEEARARAAMMDIERAGGVLEKYQKTVSDNLYKSGGSNSLGGINRQLSKYSANSAKFANNLRAGASAIGLSDDDLNKYLQHLEDLAPFSNDLYSITRARTGDRSVLEGVDQKSDQYKDYERLLKLSGYDATGKKLLDQNNAGSLEELTKLYGDFDLDNAVQTVETYYRMINTPAMAGVPVDPTNYEKAADDIEAFTGINVRDLAPEQVKGVLDEVGANREYIDYLQSYLKQEQAAAEEAAAEAEFDNYIQQKYGQYWTAPDWETHSKAISLDINPTNEAEMIHEAIVAIDNDEVFDRLVRAYGENGMPPAAMQKYNGSTIAPEQRQMYYYLWDSGRRDEAMQYLEDIDWSVRKATAAKTEEVSEELSDGVLGGAAASIASVLASPARAITTPMNALRTAAGETIDQYDSAFNVGRASDTILQNVGGNLDEFLGNANILGWNIGSGLYNAAMSAADSWMLAPFGATGAAAAMGLEASDSTMREALANGRTQGEALRDAAVTAGIESITEKLPMETLFGDVVTPGKYFISNALAEMGEELTSEGLNMLYDTIAYGDESDLGKVLADLRVHGYAGKDLTLAMVKEIAGRMRDAGFGGLAGGGFGAAGRTVTFAAENASIKKNLSGNDAVKPMLNLAETLNLPEDIRAIVQDQLKAVADGKKVSAAKIGRIFRETMKAVDENTQSVLSASMSRNVAGMLRGVGVDDPAIAEAVTRIVADNGTVSMEDYNTVAANSAALEVTQKLVSRYNTGMETQRKAEEIAKAARGKVEKPAQANNPPKAEGKTEHVSETDELTPEEMEAAGIQSDVQIDEQAAKEMVDAAAAEYGRNANIVAAAYEAGQDPVSFNQQFRKAYQYGEEGRNYDVISKSSTFSALNEQQIKKAYLMGRDVRVQRAQEAAKQPVGRVKVGNVDTSKIRNVKLNDYQKAAISSVSELAKAVGFNVEFVARGFDKHGKAKRNVNGTWSKETRTITLDVNAGRLSRRSTNYAIMQTAGHELTHFIKAFADADLWNSYQEFVFGHLSEKMTEAALDAKINDYIKLWAKNNKVLTRDGAIEEIVAEASGDALLKLTEADIQQMAESNPSLLKRIGDFIQRWVKEVKSAIEQAYKGQIARNAIADQMVDVVDELGAKWAELLKNAAQHARAVKGENVAVNAQEEVKFSLQENDRLMENAAAMNSSKGNVPDDVLKKAEMDRAKVAAFMRDDSRTLNLPEDLMGNTFFSDAAYGGTEENTTVCPRSIGADAFLDAVSDKIGRPLTVAEQVRISQDVIGAADIKEPQCIYCYVAADRAAYREFLGKYIDQRDGVIDALKNGETDMDKLFEEFNAGRKGKDGKPTKDMKRRFDLWVDTYKKGKKLLNKSDLANIGVLTAIQSDEYKQLSGDPNFAEQMKDALKYAQAASWAKKRVNYVAYNGHILKWSQNRINKLNSMYGLRMYSFSDFSPAFALENMQMVTDAAVRGLKMLAYTKVPAFAEIFADTGMNINVSVFATEVKGDNGSSIVENNLMGADWKAAQKLRSEHENIGITFVATSDAQVEWALAQDWIDVCIPYHLVRTGRTIAEIMRYKNFTAESGDTKKPGWSKADGNLSSIPAALHNNDRDTYMRLLEENNLEPRFARFVDNPNYMKLVNETRQSVTTSKPVQPNFNVDAAINALQDMANNGGYYVPIGGSEQRMYELANEFADRVQAGEYKSDISEEDDTKYSVADDEEYMQAYEAGDDYTARQIVKKAAAAAGYSLTPLYHGTAAFGFTKINPEKSDDGISFFVSDDDLVAETYVGENTPIRRIGSNDMDFDKLMAADGETLLQLLQKHVDGAYQLVGKTEARQLAREEGEVLRLREIPKIRELIDREAESISEWGGDDNVIKAAEAVVETLDRMSYASSRDLSENLYIAYDDALRELRSIDSTLAGLISYTVGNEVYRAYNQMQFYLSGDLFKIEEDWTEEFASRAQAIDMLVPKLFKGIYELYGKMDNLLEVDAGGLGWRHIDGSFIGQSGYVSTREVSAYAKANGYNGVYFKNIVDVGGMANYNGASNVLTFFNPNDLKSADPYTYDDDGNLIPPSQRFNSANDDIRYSIEEDDYSTKGMKWAVEEGLLTKADQKIFHDTLASKDYLKYNVAKTKDGKYVVPGETVIMFASGTYKNPVIEDVVIFNVPPRDYERAINNAMEVLYGDKRSYLGRVSKYEAYEALEALLQKGSATVFPGPVRTPGSAARYGGRGKGNSGRTVTAGSGKRGSKKSVDDYQIQDPNQITDRELLANVMETAATNEVELDFVRRYRKQLDQLDQKQADMEAAHAEMVAARKAGKKDEAIKLKNKVDILAKQIDRMDGQLLKFEAGKPLQAVVKRQREQLREKANERIKKRVEKVRQQEAEKRDELRARIDTLRKEKNDKIEQLRQEKIQKVKEVRDEKNESFARQKYLDEVKKSAGKLREMVTSPTNKKHVPQVLRQPLADFLTALDFTSAQQLNGGEATKADNQLENAMLKMKDALQKVQNSQNGLDTSGAEYFGGYMDLPAGYAETFDQIIGKVRAAIAASDGINGTPINRMKSADLHELAKHLRILHSAINSMNALISNAKYATADAASRDTIADLDGIKAKKDQNVLFQKISDFIDWKNSVPYYAFQRMGRGGKAIFEALMDGWDKLAFNAQELVDFTGKTYNAKEVAEWESDIKTIELGSGESVRMSTSQLMSLYCLAKREQAMGHLMGGGIRIADIEGKRGKRISQGENYTLSESDIDSFRNALTERQRKVADALQEDMVKRGGAWGNEISMRRFGYDMFTEENYFPVESDTNNLRAKDPNAQENSLLRLLNMSATKDLTKGANNAIVVRSIFDVYTSHMSDMAKYNALGLQILDMMKWLNYVERTEAEDGSGKITTESVQKSLELAYGTEARRYIMEFIKNLNGEVEGGREDAFINKMTSNYKIAAVGANLRVGFLQITSLPRAAVAIDSKYLLAGIAKWNARKGFGKNGMSARAVDKVGIAKWKSMGFYDTNISRNMRQMIKHDESAIDKVREGSMKLAELGDAWTMGVLYGAVESELMAQGKKPGDPTWDAMMNKRMREIVYRTQVVDSTMTRSHLMRQRGFISSAMAFMSEPTLALNMVNDALFESRMNIRAGVKWNPATAKKVAKVFAVSAVVNGLAALMEAAFTAMRDDDEFETFADKYLEALLGDYSDAESFGDKWSAFFGSALGGKLNPLSNIPVISNIVDAWKSGAEETLWQAAAGELGEGIRALIKVMREGGTLADYYRAGYKTLGGASKAVGLPASNAVRDLASLYNTFAAEPMGWRRLQTYDNTESEAAAAILDAMIAGDDEKVAKIRERTKVYRMDNEKIEKSLSVRTKDAYMRGLLTKTEADKLMVNEGGMRARDADNALTEADYQIATGLKHSDMKDDFVAGAITEKQARDYLKKYDGLRDDEIESKINLWKYEKDTGYIYSEMKADFIDGELTESQVKSYRAKYGGSDSDAIEETLGHWKYERDTGLAWSDMEDDYADGVISENQARSYLAKYGGKDEEEVEEKISNFDYHIATGRSTTAPKYWRIAYAFDSGGNYGAYIDEAFNSIMYGGEKTKTWKQARSQIASSLAGYYKNQYLAARGTAAGDAMLERILDLYEAIGYDREYERKYIAENWVKNE